MSDVALTFDPTSFTKGFAVINGGLNNLGKSFDNFSKETTRKTKKVSLTLASVAKIGAAIGAGILAVRSLANQIPEIGRTFSIAGDIMMKNFLWPLRKWLVPMLQKLLDWVRDNRAMFVRWGNILVNFLKIIKSLIIGVIDFIKQLYSSFVGNLQSVFGKTTQSISEMANLILFKIALVIEFIKVLFNPLAKFLGKVFATAVVSVKAFFSNMAKGIGDLGPEMKYIVGLFKDLFGWIDSLVSKSNILVKVFKTLGMIIGTILGTSIRTVVTAVDALITAFKKIPKIISFVQGWRKGGKEGQAEMKSAVASMNKLDIAFEKRAKKREARQKAIFEENLRQAKQLWNLNQKTSNVQPINNKRITNTTSNRSTTNSNVTNNNNTTINIDATNKNPMEIKQAVTEGLHEGLVKNRELTGSQ